MTIELTQEQEQLIKGLMKTGRYESESALLSHSLNLIQEHESKLAYLRAELQKAEDSGEYQPFDVEDTIRRAKEQRNQRTAR